MRDDPSELPVNTLPIAVKAAIHDFLTSHLGINIEVADFKIIAGGCINHGGRLQTSHGDFFVKWNDIAHLPGMFADEAKGLLQIAETKTIRVPKVIGSSHTKTHQFIILEFLEGAVKTNSFWGDLGHNLAAMHNNSSSFYGLEYDNYIGSLKQYNSPNTNWNTFFMEERISKQLMLAEKSGITDFDLRRKFDVLFKKLDSLLPIEKPALIHGDLWGGNVVSDEKGDAVLIDPALYFGTAEMELAYTHLFGDFDQEFYSAYNEEQRVNSGFEDRIGIYNLYPLLVHLNLFGISYLGRIEEILDHFN